MAKGKYTFRLTELDELKKEAKRAGKKFNRYIDDLIGKNRGTQGGNHKQVGIYFLLDGKKVVYIGQSIHVKRRLRNHSINKNMKFTHWRVIECEESHLLHYELRWIHLFEPKYNLSGITKTEDGEPTKVIRVPISLIKEFKSRIQEYKTKTPQR